MTSNPEDDERLRSYLLGELSGEEADLLERRLLAEDDLFELCEAIEMDLLAASARGELAPAERERVLRRLATSPQGRERLALARSLNVIADGLSGVAPKGNLVPFARPAPVARTAFRRASLGIAAGLLAAVGVAWFVWQQPFTGGQPKVALERPAPPAGPTQKSAPATPPAAGAPAARDLRHGLDHLAREEPVEAVFTLSLASLRGAGETQEIHVPADADVVVLQLDIEGWEDAGSFHAVVRKKGVGTVWQDNPKPRKLDWGPALVLRIPAEQLTAGRYEVTVKAGSEVMTQDFGVVRSSRR